MYNRYVPSGTGYVRVRAEDDSKKTEPHAPYSGEKKYTPTIPETQEHRENWTKQGSQPDQRGRKEDGSRANFVGDKSVGVKSLLKALKLEDVDHGDLLLLLVILLLLTDGDELDMVITLGLVLLLGLGDQKSPDSGLSGLLRLL